MQLLCLAVVLSLLCLGGARVELQQTVTVSDHKEWKKLLKTRTNVLVLFSNGEKYVADFLPIYDRVAGRMRGKGTMVYVDCQSKEGKKLCKNLKIKPAQFEMKHYKDGSYHKDYDRLLQEKSLLSFMENPAADPPWSEDPGAKDVRHIEGPMDFERVIKKEKRPVLMFFYAPWCGHCKRLKPEYAAAATDLKGKVVLAGMDVDSPDSYGIRQEFNITGFPTLIYFENGRKKYDYAGGRDKAGIVDWLRNPRPREEMMPPEDEKPWSEVESDVVHLTGEGFDSYIASMPSVLVMFYAPWCGHCKAMKPGYMAAAATIKERGIEAALAAVDATKAEKLAEKYNVKGFPTLKYFSGGELKYDYGYGRTEEDIVEFMEDPKEPPPPEPDWTEMESEVNHLTVDDFKPFLKKKKHALVMFYAPWCGHCKAAKPEFMRAAEKFTDDKKTAFAAIDCTKSQAVCNVHEVTGYPTFKYFNFGKIGYRYQGPRSEESFEEFMTDPKMFLRDEL